MAHALIEWMVVREAIRKAKEVGEPRPWTTDRLLDEYRFCNVRRRDDRVSRWIRKHVIPLQGHLEFLEFLALCRWVNWPPTIAVILNAGFGPTRKPEEPIAWEGIIALINRRTAQREKAWTGAYMIRADNRFSNRGRSKADYIVHDVCIDGIGPIKAELLAKCATERRRAVIWEMVEARHCWGSFMAGQFVDDLTWTTYLTEPADNYTWAPQGPGSRRGFNRVLGRPLKERISEDYWLAMLREWRHDAIHVMGKEYNDLTLMDLQNCLCEFDKYQRAKNGEGRPRSLYRPETAYAVGP